MDREKNDESRSDKMLKMIMNAPDDARVAILYKNGEDIFDIAELKDLIRFYAVITAELKVLKDEKYKEKKISQLP